jgi:cell division protein FtsW
VFGVIMVYSASAVIASNTHGNTYHYLVKHLLALTLGTLAAVLLARFDYRRLQNPAVVYGLLAVVLALLILALISPAVRSSHRWLRLGSFSFQPSELAKLAVILFMAYLLVKKRERINDFVHTLLPVSLVLTTLVVCVLVQPDLGTALSLVAIAGIMLFHWSYIFAGLALMGPLALKLALDEPYRKARIMAFLSPWSDPLGAGFQTIQSLIALGSGGVTGLGPAASRQKLFFLPEPHTDFIYAVIGEEYGFIGCCLVLAAYALLMLRGMKIALAARQPFGFLIATGVTAMILYQALINVSVTLALLPTKGIPLPFLSSGGSSLIVCLAGIGLLLSVSKHR